MNSQAERTHCTESTDPPVCLAAQMSRGHVRVAVRGESYTLIVGRGWVFVCGWNQEKRR